MILIAITLPDQVLAAPSILSNGAFDICVGCNDLK
jgi:hypothetical protein